MLRVESTGIATIIPSSPKKFPNTMIPVMMTRGFVTNEQLNAFREAGYDDKAVIEVIAAISAHTFTNLYNHVHATDVDFPIPPTA